jgi:hypothetical protein
MSVDRYYLTPDVVSAQIAAARKHYAQLRALRAAVAALRRVAA